MRFECKLSIAFFVILSVGCSNEKLQYSDDLEKALIEAGKNREKLEQVIQHFQSPADSLKRKAAYFLIKNIKTQFHYGGPIIEKYDSIINHLHPLNYSLLSTKLDSLAKQYTNGTMAQPDLESITSEFLIQNIDKAFVAWEKPWCRHLSFDDFCEFILPYKAVDEKPENWRQLMEDKYNKLLDTLANESDPRVPCKLINEDLMSWFDIGLGFEYPNDIKCSIFLKTRSGRDCYDASLLATYSMRALGVPVAMDYTPNWANRSQGHAWNSLLCKDGKTVNFLGYENNPGMHKIELIGFNRMKFKRAKVFRRIFSNNSNSLVNIADPKKETIPPIFNDPHFIDVTNIYVPVSDVNLKIYEKPTSDFAYLCVFDNKNWLPIHWGKIRNNQVVFTDMGRDVVYLPVYFMNNQNVPIGDPFILDKKGKIHILSAEMNKTQSIKLFRKYPEDDSNKISPGDNYEVFYWHNGWQSLGEVTAKNNFLEYANVPTNALLFIRNLSRGVQERIFTMNEGEQVWW